MNRAPVFGGPRPRARRAILSEMGDLARVAARDSDGPVTIVSAVGDANDGSDSLGLAAEAALSLTRRARERGLGVRVLLVHARATRDRERLRGVGTDPWIDVVEADISRLPFADGDVDIVHARDILARLERPEQAALVRRIASLARVGVLLTERASSSSRARGGFTLHEAQALADATALRGLRISRLAADQVAWSLGPLPRDRAVERAPRVRDDAAAR